MLFSRLTAAFTIVIAIFSRLETVVPGLSTATASTMLEINSMLLS